MTTTPGFFTAEDFAEFAEFMRDTLTVELLTPGTTDPNTGAGENDTTVEVVNQPASDQDIDLRARGRYLVDGVNGALPVSRCYTAWFPWPTVPAGGRLVVKVNGRERPLLRQGPPADSGGQGQLYVLELDKPV